MPWGVKCLTPRVRSATSRRRCRSSHRAIVRCTAATASGMSAVNAAGRPAAVAPVADSAAGPTGRCSTRCARRAVSRRRSPSSQPKAVRCTAENTSAPPAAKPRSRAPKSAHVGAFRRTRLPLGPVRPIGPLRPIGQRPSYSLATASTRSPYQVNLAQFGPAK